MLISSFEEIPSRRFRHEWPNKHAQSGDSVLSDKGAFVRPGVVETSVRVENEGKDKGANGECQCACGGTNPSKGLGCDLRHELSILIYHWCVAYLSDVGHTSGDDTPNGETIDELSGKEHSIRVGCGIGDDFNGDPDHDNDISSTKEQLSTNPIRHVYIPVSMISRLLTRDNLHPEAKAPIIVAAAGPPLYADCH